MEPKPQQEQKVINSELQSLQNSYQTLQKKYFPDKHDVSASEVKNKAHTAASQGLVKAWKTHNPEGSIDEMFNVDDNAAKLNILLNKNILPTPDGKFVPVLDYLKTRYQQMFGPDATVTYEVAGIDEIKSDLPGKILKNLELYNAKRMGVRCLKLTKGDQSMLIPILTDFNHSLDDNTKGMLSARTNFDGSLAGGGILVKELSKVSQDEMLDYVLTLVHEVDHAVYYYFNTTIRQIDNKEQSQAMQSSTEAIKAQTLVDRMVFTGETQEERERSKSDVRSLLERIAKGAEIVVKDKGSEETYNKQKLAMSMGPIIAEGMAKRAEDYFSQCLENAVPEVRDEVRFMSRYDKQGIESSPNMLLYAAGRRYIDRVLPIGEEKEAYLTGAIDRFIIGRTGGTTPSEVGHQILAEMNMKRKFLGEMLHDTMGEATPKSIANYLLRNEFNLVIQFFGDSADKAYDLAIKASEMPIESVDSLYAAQVVKADLQVAQDYVTKHNETNLVNGTTDWKRKVLEAYFSAQATKSLRETIINTITSS